MLVVGVVNLKCASSQLALSPRSSLGFTYNAAGRTQKNNGNIHEQKITVPGMSGSGFLVQSYTYDALNRLAIAAEHTAVPSSIVCQDSGSEWCRGFGYDRYGNRSVPAETNAPADLRQPQTFVATTNRVNDAGWTYDKAGNVTELNLATELKHSMAYDANNRQTAFCTAAGDLGGNCAAVAAAGRTLYHYDAQGNRVKKSGPSGTSLYVYDAFDKLAAEYKDSGTHTPGTFYPTVDHCLLFSSRGEAKGARAASGRGASLLARGGVLDGTVSTTSKRNKVMVALRRASAVTCGEQQA